MGGLRGDGWVGKWCMGWGMVDGLRPERLGRPPRELVVRAAVSEPLGGVCTVRNRSRGRTCLSLPLSCRDLTFSFLWVVPCFRPFCLRGGSRIVVFSLLLVFFFWCF